MLYNKPHATVNLHRPVDLLFNSVKARVTNSSSHQNPGLTYSPSHLHLNGI